MHVKNSDEYILAIDIGTQNTKIALFDSNLNIISKAFRENILITPRPGWAEEDPELWWQGTVEGIREILSKSGISPDKIIGIGVSGQMHATVPISKDGELLSRGVLLWCDKRSYPQCVKVKQKVDELKLMEVTGNLASPSWWGFHIAWIKEEAPKLYENTFKFLTSSSFIVYKLTGSISIDWTEASGSYLMDIRTLDWSNEMLSLLNIDHEKLPPIYKSYDIVGTVSENAARITGLKPGIPVIAGAGDFLSAALGAGCTCKGRCFIMTGTASDVAAFVEYPVISPALQNLHHSIDGWITFGIVEGVGALYRWFKDNIAIPESMEAKNRNISVYQVLDEKIASINSGSEGLLVYPFPLGERPPGNVNSRVVLFGLHLSHTRYHIARAILEGIAYAEREILDEIEKYTNTKIEEVRLANGGAQSIVWSKIRANIFGKPVFLPAVPEGALLGDAILVCIGLKIFNINEIVNIVDNVVKPKIILKPDKYEHEIYNKFYAIFKKFRNTFWNLFDELAAIQQ
ncbi:FGGY family carbohydrate kinase [Ignisphaera sp. 4213-co]|uniref:FGGY family carbohydrate kinase n=1 Tax=Ignisphaera cupida TaxID=3050454 RepID=A0ABD4Z782_9CREN|nr:FGGY family carbohydrate kinase [Ignisphaera sp. 4213-co]MDK6029060.1 FGGY family carbohydrate kinase [Ignisphaera sp. 4213-co]